jgi:hypothetical protein
MRSANWEKYQESVAQRMENILEPQDIRQLATAIQLSAEENGKKTGENIPKKMMNWMTTDIRKKIQERIKAERSYQKRPST